MVCVCRCQKSKFKMIGRLALGFVCVTTAARAEVLVISARFEDPTTRYAHGILGDAIEFGALVMVTDAGETRVVLPQTRVFEDTAPRIVDVDLDGISEVLVVESSVTSGARISIYDGTGALKAATPHIGQANRWYAPVGVADLDGDGRAEVAFIDRPHLAKTLRVWRYDSGDFREIASLANVTNHRIGETDIAGGIRDCGAGPEMIVASADWTRLLAVQLAAELIVQDIGPHEGRESFAAAMACTR